MPRHQNHEIDGNYESVIKELRFFIRQLESFRLKATRDYREIKDNTEDKHDRVQLEQIRNNTLKSLQEYFKLRFDAIKLHAAIADKLSPKDNKEISEKLGLEDKEKMQAMLDKMREDVMDRKK